MKIIKTLNLHLICHLPTIFLHKSQIWEKYGAWVLGPEGTGMTGVRRRIEYPLLREILLQSAERDSLSCSNSFCLASCTNLDNSKRQRCTWQAFGTKKTTHSG